MKPCEPKTSEPLKLVGSVHEGKKPLQCDECEMLKEEEMENAGEALASESYLQVDESSVHEEMKPCEHKTFKPLKLVGSVHEGKKPLQCDECEMLKEEEMENAGEALASESDANHEQNSSVHEEIKPCGPKTLKLMREKQLQCDECEMLEEEEMENAGEALASESDLKLHKSAQYEEKKHKKRYI